MKKLILIALGCITISVSVYAQKLDAKVITLRGPFKTLDPEFENYTTTRTKFKYPESFTETLKENKIAFSPSEWEDEISVGGYATAEDADYNIVFEITDFFYRGKLTYQKYPAIKVGIASQLTIQDKDGKTVYSRVSTPSLRYYTFDANVSEQGVLKRIVQKEVNALLNDFTFVGFHQPFWKTNKFGITVPKKEESEFLKKFNAAAEVFDYLPKVNRNQWSDLFTQTRPYWEGLRKYNDHKDKDVNKRIRFAANYNLAVSYLISDDAVKAESYLADVRENDSKFLGLLTYSPELKRTIDMFKTTKTEYQSIDLSKIERVQPLVANELYKDSPDKYEEILIPNGTLKTTDGKTLRGDIIIDNENPPVEDWRSGEVKTTTLGGIGKALSSLSADGASIRVKIPNAKKGEKAKLSETKEIQNAEGHTFYVFKTGSFLAENKRYAILDKVEESGNYQLYKELFPRTEVFHLKKKNSPDLYQFKDIGTKKNLMEYFAACPQVVKDIDAGKYNLNSEGVVKVLFTDASEKCKK